MIKLNANTTSKDFEQIVKPEMEKAIDHLKKELVKIRTGRANPAMVENVKVLCYGDSLLSIRELASIAAPDPRMIVMQPYDKSIIPNIEKAIMESDIGITPVNDGDVIRLQLPFMSAQQRDDLTKILGKKIEECRISIRNVRKDFQNEVRELEKKHEFSIDFSKVLLGILQNYTDKYIKTAEDLALKKEQEIKA